ncbi:hypothetical protein, partial [Raoultella planticola]|uniref:hypothetical protein n=1 Tax=Raoultella planticola TaxID=575 RepID=UPI003850FF9A
MIRLAAAATAEVAPEPGAEAQRQQVLLGMLALAAARVVRFALPTAALLLVVQLERVVLVPAAEPGQEQAAGLLPLAAVPKQFAQGILLAEQVPEQAA